LTLSQALGLGVLQGVTEFFPISSSGHLVLAQNLWPGLEDPSLLFNVVVHLGTTAAIVVVLRRRVAALLRAAVVLPFTSTGRRADPVEVRWIGLIILASIPTAAIGLALRGVVGGMQTRPGWVGVALLVTAATLFGVNRYGRRARGAAELGWLDAVIVGVTQGLAVIPGLSRSGVTVAAGLVRHTRAEVAVEFSMLISIPAILGANLLEGARAGTSQLSLDAAPLLVGLIAAFVAGALSLKVLQWAVSQRRLAGFAVYCGVLGLGALSLG
jgi:undecaprenyl-diphosphatase